MQSVDRVSRVKDFLFLTGPPTASIYCLAWLVELGLYILMCDLTSIYLQLYLLISFLFLIQISLCHALFCGRVICSIWRNICSYFGKALPHTIICVIFPNIKAAAMGCQTFLPNFCSMFSCLKVDFWVSLCHKKYVLLQLLYSTAQWIWRDLVGLQVIHVTH